MFCKYCGHPLTKGNYCGHCGKENVMVKQSTDLDVLMNGAPGKTYQQGLSEGYANGRKEGYEAGKKEADDKPVKKLNLPLLAGIAAAVVLLVGVTGGILAYRAGYSSGETTGVGKGWADALAAQQYYNSQQAEKTAEPTAEPVDTPVPTQIPRMVMLMNAYPEQWERVIKKDDRGNEVKGVQQLLVNKGWDIDVDGVYGKMTAQAVREFQQYNQLEVTGEADLWTCWLLLSDASVGNPVKTTDTPAPVTPTPAPVTPTPEPSINDPVDGDDVNGVQDEGEAAEGVLVALPDQTVELPTTTVEPIEDPERSTDADDGAVG